MYEIIVKGTASTNGEPSQLDDIYCYDDFAEYISPEDYDFADKIVEGLMHFSYEDGELYTVTRYVASYKLTKKELEDLKEYTVAQWSDGIGEGFEQQPVMAGADEDIYISPWHRDQTVTITQEKM